MKSNNALIKTVARLSFLSSEQGAANPIFAAVARDVRLNSERYKGKFIVPIGKVVSLHPVVGEQNQAHGLWVNTAKELNKELWIEGLPILQEW